MTRVLSTREIRSAVVQFVLRKSPREALRFFRVKLGTLEDDKGRFVLRSRDADPVQFVDVFYGDERLKFGPLGKLPTAPGGGFLLPIVRGPR